MYDCSKKNKHARGAPTKVVMLNYGRAIAYPNLVEQINLIIIMLLQFCLSSFYPKTWCFVSFFIYSLLVSTFCGRFAAARARTWCGPNLGVESRAVD